MESIGEREYFSSSDHSPSGLPRVQHKLNQVLQVNRMTNKTYCVDALLPLAFHHPGIFLSFFFLFLVFRQVFDGWSRVELGERNGGGRPERRGNEHKGQFVFMLTRKYDQSWNLSNLNVHVHVWSRLRRSRRGQFQLRRRRKRGMKMTSTAAPRIWMNHVSVQEQWDVWLRVSGCYQTSQAPY